MTYEWDSSSLFSSHEDLIEDLNDFGLDGWEVVETVTSEFSKIDEMTYRAERVVYLLKKKIK